MIPFFFNLSILIIAACSESTVTDLRTSASEESSSEIITTGNSKKDQKEDSSKETDNATKSDIDVGVFTAVRWDGTVRGYAYDVGDPSKAVDVEIYLNDSSTPVQKVTANQPGNINGVEGSHQFIAKLAPETINRGEETKISILALVDGKKIELKDSPQPPKALFPPTAEDFYNSDIARKLIACADCHVPNWTIESAYLSLGDNLPAEGGTRENNLFYLKVSGNDHTGGNLCNIVDGLCDSIQSWWDMEFKEN